MKKSQTQFTQPDFSLGRNEQDKAEQLYNNFYQGTRRQIEKDLKQFSTLNSIKRIFNKTLADPNDGQILEVVKRMEKDKLLAPMAFYIANKCQSQVFNLQKAILIKMLPFFVSVIGLIICTSLALMQRPLAFNNPNLIKFLAPFLLLVPLMIWGLKQRQKAKLDMININILLQASSAYASAKAQGKSTAAAMQNLDMMRRKAKSIEQNKNNKKDKK